MVYENYKKNIEASRTTLQDLDKSINVNSLARLFVIIVGGASLFYSFQQESIVLVCILALIIVLLFAFLIQRQSRLEKIRANKLAFLRVNENEITLHEQRKTIYNEGESFEAGKHPYSGDLDIFGKYSLFTLVNRCATTQGVNILASWFDKAGTKEEALARQEASAELETKINWSQDFQTKLLFNLSNATDVKAFLARYFQDASLSFGNKLLQIYVTLVPFIFLAAVGISIFVQPIWNYIGILAVIHLIWTLAMAGKVSLFSSRIDKVGQLLAAYAEGIALVEEETFQTQKNKELQQSLVQDDKKLSFAFRSLSGLINNLDARNNMLVGSLLNMFMLWDFKYVLKIVKWKTQYADNVLVAFDVIAEFEALNSLAVLKRNNPDWCMPTLLDSPMEDAIHAVALNHPLIAIKHAVANDYESKDHRIALITGSNMAGKSTFLRTVGINAVLAYAGAVTCARSFALPIYSLISYMRIKDSLNESTSTFKAELDRMKFILTTVATVKNSFFLIDEMLRGTNSVDKYLGSKAIIKKLIAEEGKGMVATHDLQLSSLAEEYPKVVRNFHFDIQVIEGEMLFDYKLKNGKCTIFNASMLLKGIGVEVEKSDSE